MEREIYIEREVEREGGGVRGEEVYKFPGVFVVLGL